MTIFVTDFLLSVSDSFKKRLIALLQMNGYTLLMFGTLKGSLEHLPLREVNISLL